VVQDPYQTNKNVQDPKTQTNHPMPWCQLFGCTQDPAKQALQCEDKMHVEKEHTFTNWMLNSVTTPSVYVEVTSIEQVQRVARDGAKFPSPVRAIGAGLSPSDIHQNDDGTIIAMHQLRKIYGLESMDGVDCLKAEAGATFADVQEYLHKQGLEMAFSAEIGSATIGGTCFATTKDSSIGPLCPSGGLGDFQSCLMGIDMVGADGDLKQHRLFDTDGRMCSSFQTLLGSQGTRGIAVVLYIATRKCIAVSTTLHLLKFKNDGKNDGIAQELYTLHTDAHAQGGNIMALISAQQGYAFVEQRLPLPATSTGTATSISAAPLSAFVRATNEAVKQFCFQRCMTPAVLHLLRPFSGTRLLRYKDAHRRGGFRYPMRARDQRRLTFAYYSFDAETFTATAEQALAFTQEYKRETGFSVGGFAVYFVTRSGHRDAGPYAGKGAGTSFSFDPIYHDPLDARWPVFVRAFSKWANEHGGRPALNQTPEIQTDPEFGSLCVSGVPEPRFTSEWIGRFFEAKKMAPS